MLLSVSSVNPMFIFFLICRKLGVLGGWGGEAYLGANSGVGYFGEAYSYITVPITCSHQLKKKKKPLLFHWGNEVTYFVIFQVQDYFPVPWGIWWKCLRESNRKGHTQPGPVQASLLSAVQLSVLRKGSYKCFYSQSAEAGTNSGTSLNLYSNLPVKWPADPDTCLKLWDLYSPRIIPSKYWMLSVTLRTQDSTPTSLHLT